MAMAGQDPPYDLFEAKLLVPAFAGMTTSYPTHTSAALWVRLRFIGLNDPQKIAPSSRRTPGHSDLRLVGEHQAPGEKSSVVRVPVPVCDEISSAQPK